MTSRLLAKLQGARSGHNLHFSTLAFAALIAGLGAPAHARQDDAKPSAIEDILTTAKPTTSDDTRQPDPQPRRRPRNPNGGGPGFNRQGGPPPEAAPPVASKDNSEDEKNAKYLAIKGATVHTVSGPVLENVTILCRNGKITQIGAHVQVPEKAETLDATGFHVYPGLVAVRTAALIGGEPPEDTTDPFALQNTAALAAGITTVLTGNTAAKVTFGTVENMVIRRNVFENLRYRANDPSGKRRVRESFEKVRQYMRDLAAYEEEKRRNADAKAPDDRVIKSGEGATNYKLMRGEATALADAETTYDLIQLCELAEEYGISIVVRGAREAWTIAPRLGRANISAIITPRTRDDPDPHMMRPNGATIENAAILHQHGVSVAVVPSLPGISFGGLGGRDLLQLNLEAGFAVRGGLPEGAALKSVTLEAARVLGVDDRVGSIQIGKDADFVIVDAPDLLHYMTLARWTVVNGKIMYDKNKDTLFNHIRPDGKLDAPPPDDIWPRRLGADQ